MLQLQIQASGEARALQSNPQVAAGGSVELFVWNPGTTVLGIALYSQNSKDKNVKEERGNCIRK